MRDFFSSLLGDVVEVRVQKNRLVDYFESIRRKCNETAASEEQWDWDIGCFDVDDFGSDSYAGKAFL